MNVDYVSQIIASAINAVAEQVTIDLAALTCHQHGARYLYDNNYEFKDEIRYELEPIVWKFHIFNSDGIASQLTPIEQFIQGTPYETNNRVVEIIKNASKFKNVTIEQITTVDCDNIQKDYLKHTYRASEDVEVAVWEDGFIQCNCEYCNTFFQPYDIPRNGNRIQNILANYFNKDIQE